MPTSKSYGNDNVAFIHPSIKAHQLIVDTSTYSTLGKQAINHTQPTGSDVRDDDDFTLLQMEIAKITNPVTSTTLDWQHIVQLSKTLLTDKSKDILVACYLAGGLLQTRGLPGLLDGMHVINDMLATYWETLYPPPQRLRARRNALDWLVDRIKRHGQENVWSSLPPQEPELIANLRNKLQTIDALLMEKDEQAPSLQPTISQINTIPIKEDPAPAQDTDHINAATTTPAPSNTPAAIPLDSAQHIEQATDAALEQLAIIAAWYNDTVLDIPLAYRLNRIAAWARIETLPPAHGTQTMLPGPIPAIQHALHKLLQTQTNEDLIRFAETQLPNFPFWLDLNRIAAQAMLELGEQYHSARREICGQTILLIHRLPGLEQLAFAGGMPFADSATLQWLQELHTALNHQTEAQDNPNPLQTVLNNAHTLATQDDLSGAATCLQQTIDQNVAPSIKLQLRIHLCELLFTHRPGAQLDAFAHVIVTEIDHFALTTWDPPLALRGLQAAYQILAHNEENKTSHDDLLAKIISLNATAAVKLVT